VILDDQDRGFVFLNDTAPTDATIGVTMGPVLTSNDQDCAGLPTAGVEATVDGMVRALRKDTRLAVTPARPVTVAGYSGQTLDIQLAPTWVGTCPWSGLAPAALVLTVPDPPCCMFGLVGSERTRLILLDAGGSVLTIGIDSGDGSNFDRLTAQARLIIDSFEFSP
jgi:hypothetical protein